jgi:DNA repair exonuclease SbcCD nuclease subunit
MKVVITADWHFGYPGKLNDLKWAFNNLINYCDKNKVKYIFMLGDLLHDREYISHDVSNCLSDCLDYMNSKGIEMITLIGNHDMYYRHKWSVNAIKPFSKQLTYVSNISYLILDGVKFWLVPFIEHEPFYMKIIKDIDKKASENDILLTHIGIASATMNACFLVQNWNVVSFEETKFKRIYSGHFHCTQKVNSKSWYPGSPISFRFDEGLVNHGFMLYDTDTNSHEFIDIYNLGNEDDFKPPDYISAESEDISDVISNCQGNNVKIYLKDGDDDKEISNKLKLAGAAKVVLVKPKEKAPEFKKTENYNRSSNIFESWLAHDNPEHLNHELLLSLEKEIRSETRLEEEID